MMNFSITSFFSTLTNKQYFRLTLDLRFEHTDNVKAHYKQNEGLAEVSKVFIWVLLSCHVIMCWEDNE